VFHQLSTKRAEKLNFSRSPIDRGQVPLIFGYPSRENMLLALAYGFPVTHAIINWQKHREYMNSTYRRKSAQDGLENWFEGTLKNTVFANSGLE